MKARLAIVGGGVMGTSIAMHAARRCDPLEEPVVLFERAELGAGSSGRSGAILRQQYADRELVAMARDSLRDYTTFLRTTGRSIGFHRCGALTVAGPDQAEWRERLRANTEQMRELAVDARMVDAAEMRELVAGIDVADGSEGCWEPAAGFVDPIRTVREFAALARTYGATTRLGAEVGELVLRDGRVTEVRTAEGPVEVEAVVVVAGPWSGALLARAGVELPLRVLRPEQAFVDLPVDDAPTATEALLETSIRPHDPLERIDSSLDRDQRDDRAVVHPIVIDLERAFYTRCDPSGSRTRVGRIDHERDRELADPDELDPEVDDRFRAWARGALVGRLPMYADCGDQGGEAALYTVTADARPLLGRAPGVENLWVATGFSGHGFKLAPSVGLGMAQLVFGEPVSAFDTEFFSPERFAKGEKRGRGGAFGL